MMMHVTINHNCYIHKSKHSSLQPTSKQAQSYAKPTTKLSLKHILRL
jgi:hypothetical protein